MLDCYDEHELLAYIEDELAPDAAATLRLRLQSDPPVAELVEEMRRDRARLIGDPEPELPFDFAAHIEPLLVRPMLMDTFVDDATAPAAYRPGRERRRHRRERRLRSARRFAMAAAVALVATGGVWVAYTALSPGRASDGDAFASFGQPEAARSEPFTSKRPQADGEVGRATVHHYVPSGSSDLGITGLADAGHRIAGPGEAVTLEIMLVIQCDDPTATERLLTHLAGGFGNQTALVQNFSYEEAKRLEQAWLLAQASPQRGSYSVAGARPPARRGIAGGPGERFDELAERAREQRHRGGGVDAGELSRQLHGPRETAATIAQQLTFSSRGATHTISLPAEDLQVFLAQLASDHGLTTWLQLLSSDDDDIDVTRSFRDRASVQQQIQALRTGHGDVLVHLPITLKH